MRRAAAMLPKRYPFEKAREFARGMYERMMARLTYPAYPPVEVAPPVGLTAEEFEKHKTYLREAKTEAALRRRWREIEKILPRATPEQAEELKRIKSEMEEELAGRIVPRIPREKESDLIEEIIKTRETLGLWPSESDVIADAKEIDITLTSEEAKALIEEAKRRKPELR